MCRVATRSVSAQQLNIVLYGDLGLHDIQRLLINIYEGKRSRILPSHPSTSDGAVEYLSRDRHVWKSRLQMSVERPLILAEIVRGFLQSFQTNAEILSKIRSWPFRRCSQFVSH